MSYKPYKPGRSLAGMSLAEIEMALTRRVVLVEMRNGRYWEVRRNGMTKRWKTRPDEFQIPVKAGIKSHAYIRHNNLASFYIREDWMIRTQRVGGLRFVYIGRLVFMWCVRRAPQPATVTLKRDEYYWR